MAKRLRIDDTADQVKEFFKQFDVNAGEYVLEQAGKPLVGIVPAWQVGKLAQSQQFILALLEQSWKRNRSVEEKEIECAVTEAIEEVRREKAPKRP